MESSNDRQRKDRLIQTRVPQNLESTLKDEARKRRLSVSHLIRNVLEDTFHLVDNVVSEVDRVVADSVGMAQTFKRDAQRLAATARGRTVHREQTASVPDAAEPESSVTHGDSTPGSDTQATEPVATDAPAAALDLGVPAGVYGFQELVLNRAAECAACGVTVPRGARAFLGMADEPGPRIWVCQECVDALSE
jgi:hypothetical protein